MLGSVCLICFLWCIKEVRSDLVPIVASHFVVRPCLVSFRLGNRFDSTKSKFANSPDLDAFALPVMLPNDASEA